MIIDKNPPILFEFNFGIILNKIGGKIFLNDRSIDFEMSENRYLSKRIISFVIVSYVVMLTRLAWQ
jgi:hypothetical protein